MVGRGDGNSYGKGSAFIDGPDPNAVAIGIERQKIEPEVRGLRSLRDGDPIGFPCLVKRFHRPGRLQAKAEFDGARAGADGGLSLGPKPEAQPRGQDEERELSSTTVGATSKSLP